MSFSKKPTIQIKNNENPEWFETGLDNIALMCAALQEKYFGWEVGRTFFESQRHKPYPKDNLQNHQSLLRLT